MPEEKNCPACGGGGKIFILPKRVMGYTLGPNDPPYIVDEHYESCPLCHPEPQN